ncbi:hypothetical protein Agub_g3465 [Astrephomene gubernaculifera]|uniref:EF-hand domain-containing protein n=1 Tax=Astrephomene gubernaculifera TaxID=47775 RepID=A0AAD3DLC6_9CHLO|nr:hypothetical protein Agub_g3465 [Astrephomene gubernaculifera]
MGAGCSSDNQDVEPTVDASGKSTLKKDASTRNGNASRRFREDLAAQFQAEYPEDDDPLAFAKGSRERTLLKVFHLLDKGNVGYIQIPEWNDYIIDVGLTTHALTKELKWILVEQKAKTGAAHPRVTPAQFVTAMANMVSSMDDPEFGRFIERSLTLHRSKKAQPNDPAFVEDPVSPMEAQQ